MVYALTARNLLLCTTLWFALGCQSTKSTPIDYGLPPRLPSPVANTYEQVPVQSNDSVIAVLSEGREFDAALNSAASGLALRAVKSEGGLAGWEVREALWQAGSPYPIRSVHGWTSALGAPPPAALLAWLESVKDHSAVGLVRAQGAQGVAWVGLIGSPSIDLGPQPRQAPVGASVSLPPMENARYRVSDPFGTLMMGTLDTGAEFRLIQPGEWLFEIRKDDQMVALYPIYAGIEPPTEPILTASYIGVLTPQTATTEGRKLLRIIREAYGLQPWTDNVLLDQAAKSEFTVDGQAANKAKAIGYPDAKQLSCEASTLEDCVDSILWNPSARAVLLEQATGELGIAARVNVQTVELELLVSP